MTKSVSIVFVAAILSAVLVETSNGIVTSDAFGTHVVEPGERAFGVDLSGVAMLGIAIPPEEVEFFGEVLPTCTGSLITDRHILTAAHCFDSGFEEDPDGNVDDLFRLDPYVALFQLASETVSIEMDLDSVRIHSDWPDVEADLAIVALVEDAPAEAPRYSLLDHKQVVGEPIVIAGFGAPGYGATGVDEEFFPPILSQRAGLNRIEQLAEDADYGVELFEYDFDSGEPENNAMQLAGTESDLGFGDDEVFIAFGDSGGPNFVNGSIVGIQTLVESLDFGDITPEIDSSWGEVGYSLPIVNYRDFVLSATDGQAHFVPEPSFQIHLPLTLLCLMLRQNRSACHAT